MKCVVTGGSGFIGSNIVEALLKKDCKVTVIDNLSSGYKENIIPYIEEKRIEFYEADVCELSQIEKAFAGADVVFHLAASVGRQKSIDNPQSDSQTNLLGTVNVLEAMRKNSVRKIVYSSSAAIFGELISEIIKEDHPINPDSPYGVSKLAAEKMILAYCGLYDMVGVCLRYFNVYGKNQRYDAYGNVIPIFANRIFNDKAITIYGDGTQTRDFVNVKDIVSANITAAFEVDRTDVFNVGSGSSISINKLAEMMKDITNSDVNIEYAPERIGDVKHCLADAHKINAVGFKTSIDLQEGLEEYLAWYRSLSNK